MFALSIYQPVVVRSIHSVDDLPAKIIIAFMSDLSRGVCPIWLQIPS